MIRYYATVNGRIRQLDEQTEGCWIDVINPDEKEINSLIQQFALEPDFLRAALDDEESSRIESEDGNTLIILDAPVAERSEGRGFLLYRSDGNSGYAVACDYCISAGKRHYR